MTTSKIRLIASIAALLFAGCTNAVNDQSEASDFETKTKTVIETSQETVSQNTDMTESVTSTSISESITEVNEMKININGTEYSAKFYDTKAAEEFKAMLPLTLDMSELNGNEKYIYLDTSLTAESENVGHINKGDIMLYGSSCVVLFYDSFKTPYSYTRIGYIENADGIEKSVGNGSVTVEFTE